jgi:hypothetical protein
MKKTIVSLFLVTIFLLTAVSTVVADDSEAVLTESDYEVEYPAAPAVAGELLEDAGVDNRYGTGRDGGNYISAVADHMGPETDFNGVSKFDEIAYSCEIAKFLNDMDPSPGVTSPYSGVVDPVASGAVATDNADGTVTLEITLKDLCGDVITGLDPLSDFYVMDSVIGGPYYFGTGSIPGSETGKWTHNSGVYSIVLQRNYFNARPAGYADGWYRMWDIYVQDQLVEDDLILQTTYYAVGDWKLDLYIGSTLYERFIIISTHVEGEIDGFFGVGYDPDGTITGTISGTITGQSIYMFYDRDGYSTDGYTAELEGTIANDGNSMSGTWTDRDRGDVTQTWNMERQ